MTARADTSFAWGHLLGRISQLSPDCAALFAARLVRLCVSEALAQSGYAATEHKLAYAFCGLEVLSGDDRQVSASASTISSALLTALSLSRWEPLATVAGQLRKAARFAHEEMGGTEAEYPQTAIDAASTLSETIEAQDTDHWPLAALDQLHALAAHSVLFMPYDRETRLFDGPRGPITLEQRPPKPPLWAAASDPDRSDARFIKKRRA